MRLTSIQCLYFGLKITLLLVYGYLCFLMIKICIHYFPWQDINNFLVLKQDVVKTQPWRIAFQVHVITSSILLIAGFTQFFQIFRTRFRKIHRYGGWLYLVTLIFFALPSGFILAGSAAGGFATQLCFFILCIIWSYCTLCAIYYLFKKKWLKHRNWMIRSFALSLSALSLRTWKLFLYELQPYFEWLSPIHIYQLESWLGWTVNLLIAEIIILYLVRRQHKSPKSS